MRLCTAAAVKYFEQSPTQMFVHLCVRCVRLYVRTSAFRSTSGKLSKQDIIEYPSSHLFHKSSLLLNFKQKNLLIIQC